MTFIVFSMIITKDDIQFFQNHLVVIEIIKDHLKSQPGLTPQRPPLLYFPFYNTTLIIFNIYAVYVVHHLLCLSPSPHTQAL